MTLSAVSGGTFFLAFRGEETENLPFDASAQSVSNALEALPSIGMQGVSVAARGDPSMERSYTVSFLSPQTPGNQPLLFVGGLSDLNARLNTLEGLSPTVNVTRLNNNELMALSGDIMVSFNDSYSIVPHDISEAALAAELELLGTGKVNVSRQSVGPLAREAFTWMVTFLERASDSPQIILNGSSLRSSGDICTVFETIQDGSSPCCLAGSLRASIMGNATADIDLDAPFDLQRELRSLGYDVAVSSERRVNGGHRWLVTFLKVNVGDMPALVLKSSNITVGGETYSSDRVLLRTTEVVKGSNAMVQHVVLRSRLTLVGFFTLSVGSNATRTRLIPWSAKSQEVRAALEAASFDAVHVSAATAENWDGTSVGWDITFLSIAGNIPLLGCSMVEGAVPSTGGAECIVMMRHEATSAPLNGFFRLSHQGDWSHAIAHNATTEEMRTAIESIASVGSVNVARRSFPSNGGTEWTVTFGAPRSSLNRHVGDVATLAVTAERLRGTRATIVVDEVVRGSKLGGTFEVTFADMSPVEVAADCSEGHLQESLLLCCGHAFGYVGVQRSTTITGYRWSITFDNLAGDIALLSVRGDSLEGSDARVSISEERRGKSPLRGTFRLADESGMTTAPLQHDADAADIEAALESLDSIGDISVAVAFDNSVGKRFWDVTYTTLGIPANLGDLPMLSADTRMLFGSDVMFAIEEIQKGCCALDVSINGQDFSPRAMPFKFDEPAAVTRIAPSHGPISGGTVVTVFGTGFLPEVLSHCRFGDVRTSIEAVWISTSSVTCISPPHEVASVAVSFEQLSEDPDMQSRSRTVAIFHYEQPMQLFTVLPPNGPATSNTNVTIYGVNFLDQSDLTCRFSVVLRSNISSGSRTKQVATQANFHNRTTVSCLAPDLSTILDHGLLSWDRISDGDVHANLALTSNGQDYTSSSLRFRYLPSAEVSSISPVRGSQLGETLVEVTGRNFADVPLLQCQWGNGDSVAAQFLSSERLLCSSPPHQNIQSVQRVRTRAAVISHEVQSIELTQAITTMAVGGGAFSLHVEGYETSLISFNASALDVTRALEELPVVGGVDSIHVNRTRFLQTSYVDGVIRFVTCWEVKFTVRGGDVEAMVASTFGAENLDDIADAVVVRTLVDGSSGSAEAEVQVVRTSHRIMVREVQQITIRAPKQAYEIQEVWVVSTTPIAGKFILSYDKRNSVPIDAAAQSDEVRAAIQSIEGTGFVDVTRGRSGTRGYFWAITFLSASSARPILSASSHSLSASAAIDTRSYRVQNGTTVLGGAFYLSSGRNRTAMMPFDASSDQIKAELDTIGIGTDIRVLHYEQGRSWMVTFAALGDQEELLLNAHNISGNANISTVRNGTEPLGGSFKLTNEGVFSVSIAYDASAEDFQSAVHRTGDWGEPAIVNRRLLSSDGGSAYEWRISFPAAAGNVPQLKALGSNLIGSGSSVAVSTEVNGTFSHLDGNFTLDFLGTTTKPLDFNTSAHLLEQALEALPTVGDIIVSRTGPYIDHDGQGGLEWIISFTTNGFPSHLGEVPLLESNSHLIGTDADVDIEEVQEGYGPVVFVEVSNNGQEFTTQQTPFLYHEPLVLGTVLPDFGPASGGTTVTLTLSIFDLIQSTTSFTYASDVSTDLQSNSAEEFDDIICAFNRTRVPAVLISNASIECVAPGTLPQGGVAELRVSINGGVDFTTSGLPYTYVPEATDVSFTPRSGPTKGGTLVEITGDNLPEHPRNYTPQCMFGDVVVDAVAAERGSLSCIAPPVSSPRSVHLEYSYNRRDFTTLGKQYVYDWPLHAAKLLPSWGPVSGNTAITVVGAKFRDSHNHGLRCKFGDQEVPAVYRSERELHCVSPRLGDVDEVQVVAASSLAHQPEVQTVRVFADPYTPEVHNITLVGPRSDPEIQRVRIFGQKVSEVQIVHTGANLGAASVLRVQTSVQSSRREVQRLQTQAAVRHEVQMLTVRSNIERFSNGTIADEQHVAVSGNYGSFKLSLGAEYVTVSYSTSADMLAEQLVANFSSIHACIASRSTSNGGLRVWTITFTAHWGTMGMLRASDPTGDLSNPVVRQAVIGSVQEIQKISFTYGTNGGTFRLKFRGEETAMISHDASARVMKAAMEALGSIGDVHVSSGQSSASVPFWQITFLGNAGNLPCITATSNLWTGADVIVREQRNGTSRELDGTYMLSFQGETTDPISLDASSEAVEAALENLTSVASVVVNRFKVLNNGAMYAITFRRPYGDVPTVDIEARNITGSALDVGVREDIRGNKIGGSFIIYNRSGWKTEEIPYDASAEVLENALRKVADTPYPHIEVSRHDATAVGGFTWLLTFPEAMGNSPLLLVNAAGLSGESSRAHFVEYHQGRVPEVQRIRTYASSKLHGSFRVGFRGAQTTLLPHNATSEEVENALESLGTVGDVTVSRKSLDMAASILGESQKSASFLWVADDLDDALEQFEWLVTFSSHVGPQNLLTACCGAEHSFTGKQTLESRATQDARVDVERLVFGTGESLEGHFRISIDNNESATIPVDASEGEVAQHILNGFPEFSDVNVSRSVFDENGATTWSITFSEWLVSKDGTVEVPNPRQVSINTSGLLGTLSDATVALEGIWSSRSMQELRAERQTTAICTFPGSNTSAQVIMSNQTSASQVAEQLAVLQNSTGLLRVTKRNDLDFGITFLEYAGISPLLSCAGANVTTLVNGTSEPIAGNFSLIFRGNSSQQVPVDAPASQLEMVLNALDGVTPGDIVVTEDKEATFNGGRKWRVTFNGSSVDGNVPLLSLGRNELSGTNPFVDVSEIIQGNEVSGTFELSFGTDTTYELALTASARDVQSALESLPSIDRVSVNKVSASPGSSQGYQWDVTFLPISDGAVTGNAGNLQLMTIDGSKLGGMSALAQVQPIQDGTPLVSSKFKLYFGDHEYLYERLHYDESAETFKMHLEKHFDIPKPVSVERHGPSPNGAYTWLVTLPIGKTTGDNLFFTPDILTPEGTALRDTQTPTTYHLGGDFHLAFSVDGINWETTGPIPYNATAKELESVLGGLSNLPNVTVTTRTPEGFNGNKSWDVTFTSLRVAGDLPLMRFDNSNLDGTGAGGEVNETLKGSVLGIQEITISGAGQGSFSVAYNNTNRNPACENKQFNTTKIPQQYDRDGEPMPKYFKRLFPHEVDYSTSKSLPWNASAAQVQEAVSQLSGLGNVLVERSEITDGVQWLVLVMARQEDTHLLDIHSDNMPPSSVVSVSRFARSSESVLAGNMTLRFPWSQKCVALTSGVHCTPAETESIGACANESEVEHALRRLPGVYALTVRRNINCGILRWNGTITEAIHRVCRYEIEFHDVVANTSGSSVLGEYPWTWNSYDDSGPPSRLASSVRSQEASPADLPLLMANTSAVRGQGAVVAVREVQPGMSYRTGGRIAVEVTQNGQDYSESGLVYEYLPIAMVESLVPSHGLIYGGTEVLVRGTNFHNSALLSCRFGADGRDGVVPVAHYFNSSLILCVAPPSMRPGEVYVEVSNNGPFYKSNFSTTRAIYTYEPRVSIELVDPPMGPTSGNISVVISGGPFRDTEDLRCKFGDMTVIALFLGPEQIRCFAPPHRPGSFPIEITLNDQDFTSIGRPFMFYKDPALSRIVPVHGPAVKAGTRVTIFGDGFVNNSLLQCRFGADTAPAVYRSDHEITCDTPPLDESDDNGSGRMTWRALSEQYNRYPDPLHGSRRLFPSAHYYPLYLSRLVAVEVTNNGQDWTDSGITFLYQADSAVITVSPTVGTDVSGTPLFVVGQNFVNSTALRCRIGPDVVEGTFLRRELVLCFAPARPTREFDQGLYTHNRVATPDFAHAPGAR